jgi:hypothetical protein
MIAGAVRRGAFIEIEQNGIEAAAAQSFRRIEERVDVSDVEPNPRIAGRMLREFGERTVATPHRDGVVEFGDQHLRALGQYVEARAERTGHAEPPDQDPRSRGRREALAAEPTESHFGSIRLAVHQDPPTERDQELARATTAQLERSFARRHDVERFPAPGHELSERRRRASGRCPPSRRIRVSMARPLASPGASLG